MEHRGLLALERLSLSEEAMIATAAILGEVVEAIAFAGLPQKACSRCLICDRELAAQACRSCNVFFPEAGAILLVSDEPLFDHAKVSRVTEMLNRRRWFVGTVAWRTP